MLTIGDAAPQIPLFLAEGTAKSIGDFKGQAVVLYFYPKDDTPGCTREALDFTSLADDFTAAGAVVIGVSKDSLKRHGNFMTKYDLKVMLASDPDGALCEAFGTWVEKSLYGRQYMGIERATFLIDGQGKIAQIWRKVKVAGHASAVLDAVRMGR
jgi:thioredoxin-dependent peroxiredoxin